MIHRNIRRTGKSICSVALLAWNVRQLAVFGLLSHSFPYPSPASSPRSTITTTTTTTASSRTTSFPSSTTLGLFQHPTSKVFQSTFSKTTTVLAMSEQDNKVAEKEIEEVIEDGVDIGLNLQHVRTKIDEACSNANRDVSTVRLVAVSKTKPLIYIQKAYENGQRIFGENYAQELVEKAKKLGEKGIDDVQWHFIGGLQSNKANMLVKGVVPYGKLIVETVNSLKVAKKLDNAMADFINDDKENNKLGIFVQVNTSGEESKSGIVPNEVPELCQTILNECKNLSLMGLMTIGAPGDENCLSMLSACRDDVMSKLGDDNNALTDLELSMGMSGDYESAIAKGSTNVRVGSTIFGARDYSK